MTQETLSLIVLALAGMVAGYALADYRVGVMMEQDPPDRMAHYETDGWKCVAVIPTAGRREMTRQRSY